MIGRYSRSRKSFRAATNERDMVDLHCTSCNPQVRHPLHTVMRKLTMYKVARQSHPVSHQIGKLVAAPCKVDRWEWSGVPQWPVYWARGPLAYQTIGTICWWRGLIELPVHPGIWESGEIQFVPSALVLLHPYTELTTPTTRPWAWAQGRWGKGTGVSLVMRGSMATIPERHHTLPVDSSSQERAPTILL
jgi:hypothetical protein